MKNHLLGILLLVFLYSCSNTQDLFIEAESSQEYSIHASMRRTMDLIHTELELEPLWSTKQLRGTALLTLSPYFYVTDSIVLDAQFMDILDLKSLSSNVDLTYEYDSVRLSIVLSKALSRTDTIQISIDYMANPEKVQSFNGKAITDAKGLYFIEEDSSAGYPNHLWTQGETKSSSCWFPTIDHPNVKTSQKVSLIVDTHLITVSNGKLIEQVILDDGRRKDVWEQALPHAPYLAMLFVGPFVSVSDYWVKSNGDTMPLHYVVEPKWAPFAKSVFGHTPEMLRFYSDTLGFEFPWDKYDQIVVRKFVSGAMENTSASIFYDGLNMTDVDLVDGHQDEIIAHELFHQWFGDLVTCESWANLALNEAFATYGEYLWNEHKYGKDEADWRIKTYFEQYLDEAEIEEKHLIRYRYEHRDDLFDAHSYQKGAQILHMLRRFIGDEAFFESLELYLNRYAYKTVEVDQLRLVIEEVSGLDMAWFFDQWMLGKGHAKVKAEILKRNATEWDVVLTQKEAFRLPIDFEIKAGKRKYRQEEWLSSLKDTFSFQLPDSIEHLMIDPGKELAWEIREQKSLSEWISIYKHSNNAIDRYKALQQIDSFQTNSIEACNTFRMAIHDDFYAIRANALYDGLFESFFKEDAFVNEIKDLAKHDANSEVREAAIAILLKINAVEKHDGLNDFVEQRLTDSSILVKSMALHYLAKANPDLALEKANAFIKTDHIDMAFSLANVFAKSKSIDRKHVDFYFEKISNSPDYARLTFFYYFAMFTRKNGFQNLVDLNAIMDFVLNYQNKYFEKPYTRYMTGQMFNALKPQYQLLSKNKELNESDKVQVQNRLNQIDIVIKSVKSRI